jgi:hypothetical protein
MYRSPKPVTWERAHRALREFHQRVVGDPEQTPPAPHLAGGRALATAPARHERWAQTVAWARRNGCAHIVDSIPVGEFEVWIGERRLQSLQP